MLENDLKKDLIDLLACPACRGSLKHQKALKILYCSKCKIKYPVVDGIPVLTPQK